MLGIASTETVSSMLKRFRGLLELEQLTPAAEESIPQLQNLHHYGGRILQYWRVAHAADPNQLSQQVVSALWECCKRPTGSPEVEEVMKEKRGLSLAQFSIEARMELMVGWLLRVKLNMSMWWPLALVPPAAEGMQFAVSLPNLAFIDPAHNGKISDDQPGVYLLEGDEADVERLLAAAVGSWRSTVIFTNNPEKCDAVSAVELQDAFGRSLVTASVWFDRQYAAGCSSTAFKQRLVGWMEAMDLGSEAQQPWFEASLQRALCKPLFWQKAGEACIGPLPHTVPEPPQYKHPLGGGLLCSDCFKKVTRQQQQPPAAATAAAAKSRRRNSKQLAAAAAAADSNGPDGTTTDDEDRRAAAAGTDEGSKQQPASRRSNRLSRPTRRALERDMGDDDGDSVDGRRGTAG